MNNIVLRALQMQDCKDVSTLIKSSPPLYTQYFCPFDFEQNAIEKVLSKVERDQFIGIALSDGRSSTLAGFYMLRGFDEGYEYPMYGVFIGHAYRDLGLASLTLAHAEAYCRLNRIARLLLKVHPSNERARRLYEKHDFHYLRTDPINGNLVLERQLSA